MKRTPLRKTSGLSRPSWPVFSVVAGLVSMALGASGQYRPKDGEWPTYGADLAGSKYRPLDQINAYNFSKLESA